MLIFGILMVLRQHKSIMKSYNTKFVYQVPVVLIICVPHVTLGMIFNIKYVADGLISEIE